MIYTEATWFERCEVITSSEDGIKGFVDIKKRYRPSFYFVESDDEEGEDPFPDIFPCTAILRRALGFPWFCTFWFPFVYRVRKHGKRMIIHNSKLGFPGDKK